ncbi:hypothetical protein IW262DRAFT_1353218 [Armillaria fumosa]|nr:hypothetical protein IW262DRAFT_1353218 [Armillaria fumosa]
MFWGRLALIFGFLSRLEASSRYLPSGGGGFTYYKFHRSGFKVDRHLVATSINFVDDIQWCYTSWCSVTVYCNRGPHWVAQNSKSAHAASLLNRDQAFKNPCFFWFLPLFNRNK